MKVTDHIIEFLQKLLSALNNFRPIKHQLLIPDWKRRFQIRPVMDILQQFVALLQDLVILCQIMQINTIQLTQLHIHKSAASRRTILDDIQILRRKNNQIQDAEQLPGFSDGNAVHSDAFCTVFLQMDINAVIHTILLYDGTDMRLLRVKTDHFPVFAALVGLCRSTDIQRFQHICLSLGIISVQDVGPGIKSDSQGLIVAKIL